MSLSQTDLVMMEFSELKKVAERYQVKTAGQSREQVLEAIQFAAIKKEEDLRHKVTETKRAAELLRLGIEVKGQKRPSAEDVAILASKKVRVVFLNREDGGGPDEAGADVVFQKGSFHFHLFDGLEHILPECLLVESIDEIPEIQEKVVAFFAATGMKVQKATEVAKGVLQRLSLPISCKNPVYEDRKTQNGETVSSIVRWYPRFAFTVSRQPVPENAEFGPVESEVLNV